MAEAGGVVQLPAGAVTRPRARVPPRDGPGPAAGQEQEQEEEHGGFQGFREVLPPFGAQVPQDRTRTDGRLERGSGWDRCAAQPGESVADMILDSEVGGKLVKIDLCSEKDQQMGMKTGGDAIRVGKVM